MRASKLTLRILAGIVWYIGGFMLCANACRLLMEANGIVHGGIGLVIAPILGIIIGLWRGKMMFAKGCRRNLDRIAGLENPTIIAFYRPIFFLMLGLMIGGGATISHFSHGHYIALLVVAVLDFAVGIGLLSSSYLYWKYFPSAGETDGPSQVGASC